MGSPFRTCDLHLHLDWTPDLPGSDFQDLVAESPDGRYLGLVQWHIRDNIPGFLVHTLDTLEHAVATSEPQRGCCDRLWWDDGAQWTVWRGDA